MLRDEIKNKKYFDKQIKELDQLNEKRRKKLNNNKVETLYIPDVIKGIFDFNLRKVFSMYSRGDDVEDIKIQILL